MEKSRAKTREWLRWVEKQIAEGDPDACWLWPFHTQSAGYGQARWRGRDRQASRVVYEIATCTVPPDDLHACHTCDMPLCVNPNHIFFGTDAENQADSRLKGRGAFGVRQGSAKLTDAAVLEIRSSPETNANIARRLGVDPSTVSKIRSGIWWRHVAPKEALT